ncbi:hypothetical protein NMY22_g5913 [Coprinellus aureogranulatus]|nr:hypothetical protein NMY22_g5913 [Coprinellus aureogranulatus]
MSTITPSVLNGDFDKSTIADLVAKYGSSSTTAWLEFERYKIWRPSIPIPESEFPPVQGYMTSDGWIFAWGNPLVSHPAALAPTVKEFVKFAEENHLHPVFACVDAQLERILGEEMGWRTVSCIYEDYVDPAHLIELTSPEHKGEVGQHAVKDLKKNLMRAEKYHVVVSEVKDKQWSDADKRAVEQGIEDWKKSRSGIQIASTTLQPWLDQEHRRYWVARQDGHIVGILILTPVHHNTWQIKNAVSFPKAPKGTSEALIYTALKDLHAENGSPQPSAPTSPTKAINGLPTTNGTKTNGSTPNGRSAAPTPSSTTVEPASSDAESGIVSSDDASDLSRVPTPPPIEEPEYSALDDENRVVVTFGISASPELHPVHNLGGWKVKALSKTYKKVASSAKLVNRGEFRRKFDSEHKPMYVCYPADGFGLDGVNTLFKLLRKLSPCLPPRAGSGERSRAQVLTLIDETQGQPTCDERFIRSPLRQSSWAPVLYLLPRALVSRVWPPSTSHQTTAEAFEARNYSGVDDDMSWRLFRVDSEPGLTRTSTASLAIITLNAVAVMSEETSQSAPMKIAVFGTRKYDQDSLKEANEKAGSPLEFTFIDALLDHRTTVLASGHEGICIFVNDICDAAVLEQLHALGVRFVALRCAGFNNVDLKAAHNLGIKVARVPSYSPEAVAEFCVGMIMTVVRKYHKAYNRVREGNFLLDGLLGFNLNGKTIGIIGTGKIGLLTGRILSRGFQANVIAYDPYPNEKVAEEYGIKYVGELDELLKESDIISLHCPLMESTKYIISDATIPKMKKGVVLINTSRGGLIDTYALIRGLKSGHIAAVGLDVYERESSYFFADSSAKVIDDDTFARLLSFYNVFMTGHQAFLTVEALTNIADTTVLNLIDLKAKGTCACILGASD